MFEQFLNGQISPQELFMLMEREGLTQMDGALGLKQAHDHLVNSKVQERCYTLLRCRAVLLDYRENCGRKACMSLMSFSTASLLRLMAKARRKTRITNRKCIPMPSLKFTGSLYYRTAVPGHWNSICARTGKSSLNSGWRAVPLESVRESQNSTWTAAISASVFRCSQNSPAVKISAFFLLPTFRRGPIEFPGREFWRAFRTMSA